MFTLQILDRGQTLLVPLPSGKAVLGSGEDADIRLGEAGVESSHVRFDTSKQGVLLTPTAALRINGEAIAVEEGEYGVESVRLELGDRLEIGRAVVVVGRSVQRAAAPDDVLDGPRRRSTRRPRAESSRSRTPLVVVAVAVVLVALFGILSDSDEGEIEGQLSVIAIARDKGDLAEARRYVEFLRAEWAGATDGRLARLQQAAAEVEAIATAEADLERQVLDQRSGTYSDWVRRLQGIEVDGSPTERIAARRLRSRLRDTLESRPPSERPASSDDRTATRPTDDGAGAGGAAPVVDEPAPARPEVEAAAVVADADRLVEQGLFAQALELLRSQMGASGDAVVVQQLRERQIGIEAAAATAMQELVADARQRAAAGEHGEAITRLALAQHRFPTGGRFEDLSATLAQMERAARDRERAESSSAGGRPATAGVAAGPDRVDSASSDAAGGSASDPSNGGGRSADGARLDVAELRDQLDRIRDAEASGAFARAAALLRAAIERVRASDPAYAQRLEVRAIEAGQRAAFHADVQEALAAGGGREFEVELRTGGAVRLDGASESSLRAGARVVLWPELAPSGIAALAQQVGPQGASACGAASLLYAAGDLAAAERLLVAEVRADADRLATVAQVLARGRGDAPGSEYELRGSQFVAANALAVEQAAEKVASRIDRVFRSRDPSARQDFLQEQLAEGADHLEAVGVAFRRDLMEQIDKLSKSPLRKQIQTLAEQREVIDRARAHSRELIYDEEKYFYPYKPPAVSGARHAEYVRVQAEVNRRIAALRGLWLDRRFSVRVPRSLRTALERIEWDSLVLQRVGAFEAGLVAGVEWARAVPPVRSITIAEYCKSPAERDELLEWQRIEEYNKVVGRELSSSVRELLRITNDYRLMYRHRPLAIVPEVCAASQGHAEEMSRLGYFAHMSPTPERRTPFDRMKLAGYRYGVSENIALNGSALGAHMSWLGSSGHHRNLLHPEHREMGIGVDGRNWVENFGRGKTYLDHAAFPGADGR